MTRGPIGGWARLVVFAAAVYNLLWGAWIVLFPAATLDLYGLPAAANHELWQCIGMLVGVYGVGYWMAARDLPRFWPFVLIGLLGKVLGPIGALWALARGALPARFLWLNVTNDVVWLVPFTVIVWRFWRQEAAPAAPPRS